MEYSEKFLWLLDMNNLPAKYLTPKKQREREKNKEINNWNFILTEVC